MNRLNENYSDILKSLNKPNVQVEEFPHDVGDFYFSIRNSEDISIVLRMKHTLVDIIELHEKPNQLLIIHFVRSAYDIVGDGSNTLDAFYYIKYETIITKQDVGYHHKGLCNEIPFPSKLKTEDITKTSTATLSFGLPMSSDDYLKIYDQNNLCPERYNVKISLLNERFTKINPFAVGLRFETLKYSELRTIFVKGEFKDSNDLDIEIISQICNLFSKEDNDLIIDICSINVSDPLKITYRVCFRQSHVKRNDQNTKTDYTNNNTKLAYVDYPTANFYQIETICPIDELDYWKAIGEEILSMDDVDEAVKFHKQFYHSKQKFRLVKIQKQLLGDV